MSEEWLLVLVVLALGIGLINALCLVVYGPGLGSRIEEWREQQQGYHRDHSRWFAALTERLDRLSERLSRIEAALTRGDGDEEARG